jgi:hypothetical protein
MLRGGPFSQKTWAENMGKIERERDQARRELAVMEADRDVWKSFVEAPSASALPKKLTVQMAAVFEGIDLTGADEIDYRHLVGKHQPEWEKLLKLMGVSETLPEVARTQNAKDAARYRWLTGGDDLRGDAWAAFKDARDRLIPRLPVMGKGSVDTAIDAAMSSQHGPGRES